MKKYSLKYHLLNENPTLDVGNIEDQTETFPFRLDLGEFAEINSNLTPDSFNDLLYLVNLQDSDLFKDILIKNINVQSSSQVLDNIRNESQYLKDSIESLEESFDSLILHIIEEIKKEIPSSTQDQSLYNPYPGLYMGRVVAANNNVEAPKQASLKTAGYIRNTSGKNNLFENASRLTPVETQAIESIRNSKRLSKDDADRLIDIILSIKNYIAEIKEIAKSEDIDIEASITSLRDLSSRKSISLINLFQSIPTAEDLKTTISKVVDSEDREVFKEKMQICIYQSCGLHKPDIVFEKMDSLLNIAKQAKDTIDQIQDTITDDEERNRRIQDVLTNLDEAAKRIVRLNETIDRYKKVTGINFLNMSTDANLKDFFTRQGTKIGYLLEDIIGSIYNGTTGDGKKVIDSRLNSLSGEKSNPIKTKPYALAMCAVITNKLDEIAGGRDKIINSSNYAECLSKFIKDHIMEEGKAKVTEKFKVNIEKILRVENSYMHSVDNILSVKIDTKKEVKNSGFDFLISSTSDDPVENSEVIVFDLKSSHVQSSSIKASRTPTGSNLKNHATNELITLSNVRDDDIIDIKGKRSNERHDEVNLDQQKGYKIKCVSLVKVKWSIENKFNIESIDSSMTSLYSATRGSAQEPQLNFYVKDSRSALNNFNLFKDINDETLNRFLTYVENEQENPNAIVKDERLDRNMFKFFVEDFEAFRSDEESHFRYDNNKIIMKDRYRDEDQYNMFTNLYKFFISHTTSGIETFRKDDGSNNDIIESIKPFFEDVNKLNSIKENLVIAHNCEKPFAIENTYFKTKPDHERYVEEKKSNPSTTMVEPRVKLNNLKSKLIRLFLPKKLTSDYSDKAEFDQQEDYEHLIADLTDVDAWGKKANTGGQLGKEKLRNWLTKTFEDQFNVSGSGKHAKISIKDSYNRKGKVLREVYSHLFRK